MNEDFLRNLIESNPALREALIKKLGIEEPSYEGFPIIPDNGFIPIGRLRQIIEDDFMPKLRNNMLNDGYLAPVGVVYARNAPTQPWLTAPDGSVRQIILSGAQRDFSPAVKDEFSYALKKLSWQTNSAATCFASEAWLVKGSDKDNIDEYRGRLQEHPDHVEVVTCMIEYEWKEIVFANAEVSRNEAGEVTDVAPWELTREYDMHLGRFTGFILKNLVHAA